MEQDLILFLNVYFKKYHMQFNLVLAVMQQYPFQHGRKENVASFQHAPPVGQVETVRGGVR